MHQSRIVADEQGAASQYGRRGQQIDLADQVDLPIERDRRKYRLGLSALMRGSARHSLPRQFAAGPIAKTGAPGEINTSAARSWRGAIHSRGLGGGSR